MMEPERGLLALRVSCAGEKAARRANFASNCARLRLAHQDLDRPEQHHRPLDQALAQYRGQRVQAAQRRMVGRDRRDREALLREAATHVAEGTIVRLVVAEFVIGLRLAAAGCRRKPTPSWLDAARYKACDHPFASRVLGQPMHERHEEMRLDRAHLAGMDW